MWTVREGRRIRTARDFAPLVRKGTRKLRPLAERRRAARFRGEAVVCDRGSVVDFSEVGLRLRTDRRLQSRLEVRLRAEGHDVTVRAKVVWSRRIAYRKYEIGLDFREVDEDTARALSALAESLKSV